MVREGGIESGWRPRLHDSTRGRLLVIFVVQLLIGTWVAAAQLTDLPPWFHRHAAPAVLAFVFGSVVGVSELVSRYRDEPLLAVTCNAGVGYTAMNGLVSAATYALLTAYADGIFPGLKNDRAMTAVVAGFGAMAILRSKFFTLRTAGGEEIGVGPDAALSAILSAADRRVDRIRAAKRLFLVYRRARTIKNPDIGGDFLTISLAAFQNLTSDERAEAIKLIDSIKTSSYPPELKVEAMCYAVLSLTGEHNFEDILDNMRDYEERQRGKPASP